MENERSHTQPVAYLLILFSLCESKIICITAWQDNVCEWLQAVTVVWMYLFLPGMVSVSQLGKALKKKSL